MYFYTAKYNVITLPGVWLRGTLAVSQKIKDGTNKTLEIILKFITSPLEGVFPFK